MVRSGEEVDVSPMRQTIDIDRRTRSAVDREIRNWNTIDTPRGWRQKPAEQEQGKEEMLKKKPDHTEQENDPNGAAGHMNTALLHPSFA
jgi:hypothetical protein